MTSSRVFVCVLAWALTACTAVPPNGGTAGGGSPKPGKTVAPTRVGPSAEQTAAAIGGPSAAPGGTATPAPTAGPLTAAPAKLIRPGGGTITLSGRVSIEATYAVGRGHSLISDKGAGLISDKGAGLVGNNGGAVVALGARLDAAGGRLVSNNGGAVLAEGAGNIVAPGGAGIAAELAGGTLMANNGGNLTSKTKYRLGQAADKPSVGTQAAAAGMLVSVVSLRDRRYLPLGKDGAGQDVYAVFSNAAGEYEVYVPAGEAGNILVVASAPGEPDPRLAYNIVARAEVAAPAAATAVDEVGALLTRYLRRSFTGRLADALVAPELTRVFLGNESTTSTEGKVALIAMVDTISAAAKRAGIDPNAERAKIERKAQRIVDVGLADLELDALQIDAASVANWNKPAKPALATMRVRLGELLDGTARRMAAKPGLLTQQFLESEINAPFEDGTPFPPIEGKYEILKPSDFGDFMLAEYFSAVRTGSQTAIRRAYRLAFGAESPRLALSDPREEARALEANEELRASAAAIIVPLCKLLSTDATMLPRIEAILREAD